ncbi:PucR family transcriptional regulator [Nocardia panacis]|uniref:PucR family transcriptional regulator n=1 Tax=Nocardia panacis TaxID=2340916 RepID=A0A3A4JP43_9NOCA|nr:helix-turn-helix domain-containing protein [Nocardia panacis]RJO70758.1 PucR family transcriptional regulator [Nocardia panacis]
MSADRDAVRRLCEAVARRIENDNPDLTARIRAELPSYGRISLAEHRRTVHELARRMLTSIAHGGAPIAEHLQYTRRAALRRAQLGVSAYDVLRSFHIVSRGLWSALQSAPEASEQALIQLVQPLGTWTEAMTAAVVDAFVDESSMPQAREAEIRRRLIARLGDPAHTDEVAETARTLAFDIEGRFQAVCAPRETWPDAEIENLQRTTRRLPGVVHCGARGRTLVVLIQDCDVDSVLRAAQGISGERARFGIGLVRTGLDGAQLSTVDAERALRIAEIQGTGSASFADCWLEAALLDRRAQLAELFDSVQRVAQTHPDLAEAVITYAESGFSLARAAERLRVHPNSVAYRLSRWHQLTGADPRTFSGLVQSVSGCRLLGPHAQ